MPPWKQYRFAVPPERVQEVDSVLQALERAASDDIKWATRRTAAFLALIAMAKVEVLRRA